MSLLQSTPPRLDAPEPPAPGDAPAVSAARWDRRKIAAGLALVWLLSGVYIVPADQQAVVTRFGRVVEPRALPGIHMALPWPIDSVTKLKVQQLQRLVVGGAAPDAVLGRLQPLASQFLTGDQNIINLRVVVQYSVGVPSQYLFRAEDTARSVTALVESELARRVARRDVDAVLTTEKAAIQEEVRGAAQRLINDYALGVILAGVSIESAQPPPESADAFRDVASARADSARIVNEAHGYDDRVRPGLQTAEGQRSHRRCVAILSGRGGVWARRRCQRPAPLRRNDGSDTPPHQKAARRQPRQSRSHDPP
jgi:regulator of protease activity HflC (stomatin/prohibitin superfamily)